MAIVRMGKGHVGLYAGMPHVAFLGNEMSQILKKKNICVLNEKFQFTN